MSLDGWTGGALAVLACVVASAAFLGLGGTEPVGWATDGDPDGPGAPSLGPRDTDAFNELVCPEVGPLQECNVRATDGAQVTEIDVAVDPDDPDHWVAVGKAVNDRRYLPRPDDPTETPPSDFFTAYATTFDGGLTWTWDYLQNITPVAEAPVVDQAGHAHSAASDPTVAFTSQGNVIVTTLGIEGFGNPVEVRAHLSTDGGRTFQRVADAFRGDANATVPADKPWVEVDRDRGRVHVATAGDPPGDGSGEEDGVYFTSSRDEGRTWSDPVKVCGCATPHFAVGPDGSIHLVAMDTLVVGNGTIVYSRSLDGGRTWSEPVPVAAHDGVHQFFGANGRTFRASNIPYIAVGRSVGTGPAPIHVVWGDHPDDGVRPPCTLQGACLVQTPDWNVYLSRSADGGVTWEDPVQVNDGVTTRATAALNPMVETGPLGGVHVAWIDQRRDPTGLTVEVRHDFSWNGSAFGEDLLVSDLPAAPRDRWNDYLGLEATGDQAYLAWPDTRFGTSDIMTARIQR